MVITSQGIYSLLKPIFPDLNEWLPTDNEYETVSVREMTSLIDRFRDPANTYRPHVWACEEIAMAFVVDVRRAEKDDLSTKRNRAIGEALGDKWDGVEKQHHANIFIADDGVYLFDMQTKKIWPAQNGQDNIYFVRL